MTTATGAALLRAILLDPDDVSRRLVYADWLEDNDPDRAEFIRVQMKLQDKTCHAFMCGCGEMGCDRCECSDYGEYDGLRRRELELLAARGRQWAKASFSGRWDFGRGGNNQFDAHKPGHPKILFAAAFRRGFVESVTCTLDAWERHGPAVVLAQPVLSVRLVGAEPLHVEREPGFNPWTWLGPNAADDQRPEYRAASLPQSIYDLCPDWYATREDALDALSRACVTWARRKAGLDVPCPTCKGRLKLIADPRCRTCEGLGRVDDPGGEEGYLNDCIDCPDCNPVTCPACKGAGWVTAR